MSRVTARQIRPLLVLNGVLLGVLALVTLVPQGRAVAQGDAPARPRGDYVMASMEIQGVTAAGVVLLDTANQEMVVMNWDRTNKRLQGIGYRDLNKDAGTQAQPR